MMNASLTIFIVYTDDTILLGPDKDEIDLLVKRLGKKINIEDQGNLSDYLGIKIERKPDGTLERTQPTRWNIGMDTVNSNTVNLEGPQIRWIGNQGKTE